MSKFTIEATYPKATELSELGSVLAAGTQIYLSFPPGHSHDDFVAVAARVRRAGYEPVPHIVARSLANEIELSRFTAKLVGEANVTTALVIAGDRDEPAGLYSGAFDVIRTGALAKYGIREIGISGYPEGHPKINDIIINDALHAKIWSAKEQGLRVHVVSQFSFDSERIGNWIERLKRDSVDVPIKFGVAGPSSASGLLKFALRCGVKASLKAAGSGQAAKLIKEFTSESLVAEVLAHAERVGARNVSPHIYSFGGVVRTARWVSSLDIHEHLTGGKRNGTW